MTHGLAIEKLTNSAIDFLVENCIDYVVLMRRHWSIGGMPQSFPMRLSI